MTTEQSITQESAQRLGSKLRAFCDSLPEDEQQVMAHLLTLAATRSDTSGYASTDAGVILDLDGVLGLGFGSLIVPFSRDPSSTETR